MIDYVIHRETNFKNTVTIKTAVPLSHFPNVQLKTKQNRERPLLAATYLCRYDYGIG